MGEKIIIRSCLPTAICNIFDFHYDAGFLYPSASISYQHGTAGLRDYMGILFLFLYSDTGRGVSPNLFCIKHVPPAICGMIILTYRKEIIFVGRLLQPCLLLFRFSQIIQMEIIVLHVCDPVLYISLFLLMPYERKERIARISLRLALFLHCTISGEFACKYHQRRHTYRALVGRPCFW